MSDTAEPSLALNSGAKPNRRTPVRKPVAESVRQRIQRLQAELRKAQEELEAEHQKRAALVGAAALRHAERNDEFRRRLSDALRAEIKDKSERSAIEDLLA
ncbi:MAG: hypothetical protein JOY71_01875 [Acetobacteraceae bacterium]|nr:hypothetical protein [Acetobacteraceae bacterium]